MLEPHPIALRYKKMRADVFRKMKEDIRQIGLVARVVLYEGKVLDGWHRYQALCELEAEGHPFPEKWSRQFTGTLADAAAYARSFNEYRRHELTPEEKRELIEAYLGEMPEKSDRAIAEIVTENENLATPIDHKTVSRARASLNRTGATPHIPFREGKDGLQRPASQPPKTTLPDGPQPIPKKVPDRGKISGQSKADQLNAMRSSSAPSARLDEGFYDEQPAQLSLDFSDAIEALETATDWVRSHTPDGDRRTKRWAANLLRETAAWIERE